MADNLTITVERPTLTITLGTIPVEEGGSVGADLTAIEALTGTGVPMRTAADTWTLDAGLLSLAGVDTAADKMGYTTAASTWAGLTTTAYGRSLLAVADATAAKTLLEVVEGSGATILTDKCTDGINTTDNATGVDTGCAFALTVGVWAVECWMVCTSVATTTAPQFGLVASGGLTAATYSKESHVYSGENARQSTASPTALDTFTPGGNGPGATERLCIFRAVIDVSVGGTATLYLRSETSGQIVTIVKGGGRAILLG